LEANLTADQFQYAYRAAVSCLADARFSRTSWNYLYLSQKLEDSEDTASREAFLEAVANGSAVSWQHINLLGEYDFSDEKLEDTVGIKPPKLADQRDTFLGVARAELQGRNGLR
jgi:hypothetical protein